MQLQLKEKIFQEKSVYIIRSIENGLLSSMYVDSYWSMGCQPTLNTASKLDKIWNKYINFLSTDRNIRWILMCNLSNNREFSKDAVVEIAFFIETVTKGKGIWCAQRFTFL